MKGELHEEDLLANDSSVVVVTNAGYIKRMPLEEFSAQSRHDETTTHPQNTPIYADIYLRKLI